MQKSHYELFLTLNFKATQESTETMEKTSTSVEIEKNANAATATSESIASITESESLEKVRSDKLAHEDEAPGSPLSKLFIFTSTF